MSKRLDGKRIVFTGRLASMPRFDAAALVRVHGGRCETAVTGKTSILVVGQEGWPLRRDGAISSKLKNAKKRQALGQSLVIQTEEEWLNALGLHEQSEGIHRRFTPAQLGRLLKLPRQRLAAWIRERFVAPVETIDGVHFFDFQQVASLKSLWEMSKAGVGQQQLKKSFQQLARWMPNLGQAPLSLLEDGGNILVRLDQGLADPSGQLQFDFQDAEEGILRKPRETEPTSDEWHRQGIEFENNGDRKHAAAAYRRALLAGPANPETTFNLGNVLYADGQVGAAAERFRHTVELDRGFVEAWNNLGNALCDLGETTAAIEAFQRALEIAADFPDAHYNIAEAFLSVGDVDAARRHFRTYLRLEPIGAWAAYARQCLASD